MSDEPQAPNWREVHADVGSALSALHDGDLEKVQFYLSRLWLTARPLYVTEDGSFTRPDSAQPVETPAPKEGQT